MDHDRNPDRLHHEPPPEFSPITMNSGDRTGSMSLGAPPNANGDVSPIVGESGPPPPADPNAKIVHEVVNSEVWDCSWRIRRMAANMWQIGVSTLLNRLKQSIASAKVREFHITLEESNSEL